MKLGFINKDRHVNGIIVVADRYRCPIMREQEK